MPRTSTKKKTENFPAKQRKLIISRLMEISLKVDDFVYKNKPIPDNKAKLYIQEVSSYKAMCYNDPRSLQVIEKLIYCMKGIINERQELNNTSFRDNFQDSIEDKETHKNSPSPVYSITDEDKMHISQNALEINQNEESSILDVDTINLCSDDNIGRNNTDKIQDNLIYIDVHIEKAISNLSIQEVTEISTKADDIDVTNNALHYPDENMTAKDLTPNIIKANNNTTDIPGVDIDCSQSLLNNYNDKDSNHCKKDIPDENVANLKRNIGVVTNNYKSIVIQSNKSNNINSKNNNSGGSVKLVKNTCEMKIQENQPKNSATISPIISKKCIDKINPQPDFKIATNTSYSTVITTNNKDPNITSGLDQIKKSVPKKKRAIKNKAEKNSCKDSKENIKAKKASKRSEKVTDKKTNEDTKLISNSNDFTNDSIPFIYTRNVYEDLSWMENIRYVRDHTKDCDDNLTNLEESFWDNYTLPPMWDDRDFLYT